MSEWLGACLQNKLREFESHLDVSYFNLIYYAHCTPSKVGLNGIPKKYLTEDTEVYLVTRPYLTRHGNGYEPKYGELVNNTFTLEEPTNLDSGYQGKFKRGIFDVDLLNIAIKRHNLIDYNVEYNLVLTHMDCVKHDYIYFLNKWQRWSMRGTENP